MDELTLQRIPFVAHADNRLRMLKARTGITPNILCRIGFCLSLDEPGIPASPEEDADGGREINRYTLLGEYDLAFVTLLRTRLAEDGDEPTDLDAAFVAHMNRGVELLAPRLKSLADLGHLGEHS